MVVYNIDTGVTGFLHLWQTSIFSDGVAPKNFVPSLNYYWITAEFVDHPYINITWLPPHLQAIKGNKLKMPPNPYELLNVFNTEKINVKVVNNFEWKS